MSDRHLLVGLLLGLGIGLAGAGLYLVFAGGPVEIVAATAAAAVVGGIWRLATETEG